MLTPDGKIYFVGGYYKHFKMFISNIFILNEYKSNLAAL